GGGEHDARGVELPGGVVHEVGRHEPEVSHVDTLASRPLAEGRDQLVARGPHFVPDQDPGGGGAPGKRSADGATHRFVELLRDGAADVVRLEYRVEGAHAGADVNGAAPPVPSGYGLVASSSGAGGGRSCTGSGSGSSQSIR